MRINQRTLPKTFPLTREQWGEIYNCVDDETIQAKIPADGNGVTDADQAKLTEQDWLQIYLSVESKRDRLKTGFYGRDRVAREWRVTMDEILGTLSVVRDTFIGGAA